MESLHDFETPRNLFEKLIRDSEQLDKNPEGDKIFNFVSTAWHLHEWIKKSPIASSQTVKGILKGIIKDENIIHCQNIVSAKEHFRVTHNKKDKSAQMHIGDKTINVADFKREIMTLYENYFKIK